MPEDNGQQGQQTGGDQGTGQQTGQQGATGTQQGTQGQQTGTQGQGNTTGQTGSQTATQFTYAEDRSRWIPPHRLNEASQRTQTLERELQTARSQIQALTGSQPTDQNTQRAQQIRDAFFALPGMEKLKRFLDLEDEQLDALMQVPNTVQQTQQAEARRWEQHGDRVVADISTQVAEAIGADELNSDQQSDLRVAFSAWLRNSVKAELDRAGTEDPATSQILRRYEAGDPKLLQEFVARYTKNWVTPAQRRASAQNANRTRPVPNSGGRSMTTSVKRPEKFNSLDERLDYAVGHLKEAGFQFGR